VRVSTRPRTPGVFAGTVLLPAGFEEWDADQRAAVLAPERCHVARPRSWTGAGMAANARRVLLAWGELYAPEIVRLELVNVIRRLERAWQIKSQEADETYDELMQLELELPPFEPLADRVWGCATDRRPLRRGMWRSPKR
jgi:hypothetical protein